MRRWLRRILILAAVVAAAVLLRYTVFRPQPVPVTIFRTAPGLVEDTVTNSKSGTVRSRHRASISPEIGGRVVERRVREGDHVEAGEVLVRLADADYRAQVSVRRDALEAARASEREACFARDQAERDLERYLRLRDDSIVSQEILDQYRNQRDMAVARCDAARADVQQAGSALKQAEVDLTKTVIRAPFAGVVTAVDTEVGEYITPSPPGVPIPAVIEVLDPETIYVNAPLDEVDVGKVRVDQPVRITLDAFRGRSFRGHVTRVAPFVNDVEDQNRTFDVEVEFDDAAFARTLLPGTSADVEVILQAREGVLRVPTYALMEGGRVLVVRDGRLVAVEVKTGLRNWEFTEITSGLEKGDPVVVSLDRADVQAGARATIASETEK